MKKYILLLFSTISFGQASNQMVSFTAAQSLGFPLKAGQSHLTSNQCMTKDDALNKYNLNASNMSPYAGNQLVPKGVWGSGALAFLFYGGTVFSSLGEACSAPNDHSGAYTTSDVLANGMVMYSNSGLTTTFNGVSGFYSFYYSVGSFALYSMNISSSGIISNLQVCSGLPATPEITSVTKGLGSNITIVWTSSTHPSGILKYEIFISQDGNPFNNLLQINNTTISYAYPFSGTQYDFKVRSIANDGSVSEFSNVEGIFISF
jgi:hypothetical protein